MPTGSATAVVFDLDGVIRHFDPRRLVRICDEHAVDLDRMRRAAFQAGLLERLVTGGMTRAQWVAMVGERLGAPAAAKAWLETIGELDPHMVALVRELRALGRPVAILTNGTDTIDAELEQHGIRGDFDVVVSTWHVGSAKPDAAAYEAVRAELDLPFEALFFTDDRQPNIAAAQALGIHAHRFEDVDGLRGALATTGLLG